MKRYNRNFVYLWKELLINNVYVVIYLNLKSSD